MSEALSPVQRSQFVAHKFGGSSLANAERIRDVARILCARTDPRQIVVVSAMQGVTDALIQLVNAAAQRDQAWRSALEGLKQKHLVCAETLLGQSAESARQFLYAEFADLHDVLHAAALLGTPAKEAMDLVQGLGEVWSSFLLTEYLKSQNESVARLDARDVLLVRAEEMGVMVEWPKSQARFDAWLADTSARRIIVTGFVARDLQARATTLGRNGSDYSGAIFGALTRAQEIHIWTDVIGVLSADPRLVPEAVLVPEMSYHEACELAYFGAKVIHPQTMAPAIDQQIPIIIRSTFEPNHPGTRITAGRSMNPPVKGVAAASGMAILNVEGAGMIGVPGTAERVFGALREAGVSVVMISQGSSEHSICAVVRESDADTAQRAIAEEFLRELDRGAIQAVNVMRDISVLAVVGDGMAGLPGTAARMFDHLGSGRVNVRAIAQGASERNISVAIDTADVHRALRAVHAGFYLSAQTISVGIVGPGNVGAALVNQIAAASESLKQRTGLDLRVRAIAGSNRVLKSDLGLDLSAWQKAYTEAPRDGVDLDAFADYVHSSHLPHAVIVDCSASNSVAEHYSKWLAAGIHVITPNKNAGSGPLSRYQAIMQGAKNSGARFRYEATVGAGLPVVSTLRDLLDTGDDIESIEGMFSGTLAFLFNRFDGSAPFSELVKEARALGYTEPDPRDDLDGKDVARKLVILARELGLKLELGDVDVGSLVPKPLAAGSADDFMAKVSELDADMTARLAAARAEDKVLRFVAKLDKSGKASVGLTALPRTHAFANAQLTDNVVQYRTRRYSKNPLVVQGPGAGPEVTAAGVFADLLRVASYLGARV
ncbi:bifunctional aspartate kinase/homoserine dehydrogenase I [Ahniella affigens]|uniref:Bifunctional aspartokinase/homoserine dehydrogenase n=1 Tax=Ahniella affigens TaxID=2021234 RepID=A0A2P1PP46_9GAMM|nr:bifunctional aspartate kinase/homoserine dehydrogenase I [Ahniella affigens]AVP96618.1 bifunctional aspartate kinase/homoserine dehydrogenase I [Ahniella affigens]